MDQTLWCYHSYETSSAALSHGTIYLVYVILTLSLLMKFYDMTIQIKPPQQCFQTGLFVLQNFTNLMKSWIFAHFLLWSFLGLKKLTDSTFVFKHIYTDTCSVIVEGCQKLHELVFVFHQDFLNWRRFIWVCNKHLQNKYYSSRHRN